jgi:Glycosyl hydrolase family 3 C-terminal domain
MPWANSVPAIVHAWYLGNSTGDAIADVLFGKVNPSGKLPITFPARLEDVPSFGHFNVDDGKVLIAQASSASSKYSMLTLVVQVRYAEDIFVVSIIS